MKHRSSFGNLDNQNEAIQCSNFGILLYIVKEKTQNRKYLKKKYLQSFSHTLAHKFMGYMPHYIDIIPDEDLYTLTVFL